MFKGFSIEKYKQMKPPKDNSFDTMQEIKQLQKINIDKSFVKKFDDGKKVFTNLVGEDPLISKLIDQ